MVNPSACNPNPEYYAKRIAEEKFWNIPNGNSNFIFWKTWFCLILLVSIKRISFDRIVNLSDYNLHFTDFLSDYTISDLHYIFKWQFMVNPSACLILSHFISEYQTILIWQNCEIVRLQFTLHRFFNLRAKRGGSLFETR